MTAAQQNQEVDTASSHAVSMLRTLVVCDLVDSTSLVERLGDQRAAELFRKHDRFARSLVQQHGGREIDKTDGFLMMFERPIQAVAFALDYLRELAALNRSEKTMIAARVGVHVGEVVVWDNIAEDVLKGAKPTEVEGLVKPVAARLMQLALPNQILLSGVAYDIAHRAQGELGERLAHVRWRTHGRYRFKGVPDPVPVFEVGEEGIAPLKVPPWTGKAHREVPFWRRPATVAFELLLLFALVAIPAWYLLKPAPAIAFANRDWVVVGDLKNLTGDTKFDESLQVAFRIGLEQSRYVNVLPDLKARETVKLMQRDPQKTAIDRGIGAEIALRDGARALVLPTVAEIGGRVRVTAEVVDPQTQTTVYSESADGAGESSVLSSLDAVNRKLRVRLGEALATVSENAQPLEKVATKNLDALKMYSLGVHQMAMAKLPDAVNFLQEALKVDPDFAGARLQLGRLMLNLGRTDDALRELRAALAQSDRLTQRDRLLAAAHLASIESPRASLDNWKLLAEAYPDYTAGTGTYAYIAWQIANRYDADAIKSAKASASPQNPRRAPALHLLGIIELGNEHYAEAVDSFRQAEALGFGFKQYHAATLAAQGDIDGAAALLPAAAKPFGANAVFGTMNELLRLSLPLARADMAAAATTLTSESSIDGAPPAFRHALEFTDLAVLQPQIEATRKRIGAALSAAVAEMKSGSVGEASSRTGRVLLFAWLGARAGLTAPATAALAKVDGDQAVAASQLLSALRTLAQAQLSIAGGRAAEAVATLKPLLDGSELVLTHVVLLDAYRHLGDDAQALEQARWLAGHSGRAYAEYNLDKALMPFNVAETRLAALDAAELSAKRGDHAGARRELAAFRRGWREEGAAAPLLARVKKLQDLLSP